MGAIGCKGDYLSLMETRGVHHDIVQMLPAHPGVIHDDHIARVKAVQAIAFDAIEHGNAQIGEKYR